MARLIGPSEGSRLVQTIVVAAGSTKNLFKAKPGATAVFYTDQAATQVADILLFDGSTPAAPGTVTIDAYSMLPLIQFPDGVDTLYAVIDGGPAWPVYAREDDRLDALAIAVGDAASAGSVAAAQAFAIQRVNHTGTQSADTLTDGTTNKAFLSAERTKLAGVASGATANSPDATLLARANHTGTQSADTLTDGTTNKAFLATERTKLAGVATGATANATDAQLRDRSTHTGTQSADTLTDGTTNKAFLSAERTKLTGIATAATANQADWITQSRTANFTATAQNFYLVDTTSGVVVATLPLANVAGQKVAFKRVAGNAPVTINRAGSDTIGAAATTADLTLANEVWEFVSSGAGQWNLIAANKPLTALDNRYAPNVLTTGQEVFHRDVLTAQTVLSGAASPAASPRFTFFTARKAMTTTQVRMYAGGTAAGATPTLIRIGLWEVVGGAATLRASIANDTTLFSVAFASYTRSWTTPFEMVPGGRYGVAAVIVTAATAPTLGGWATGYSSEALMDPILNGILTGQTDLPASFSMASLVATVQRPFAVML